MCRDYSVRCGLELNPRFFVGLSFTVMIGYPISIFEPRVCGCEKVFDCPEPGTGSKGRLTMQVPEGHAFRLLLLGVHGSIMDVGSAGELRETIGREWVEHVGHLSMDWPWEGDMTRRWVSLNTTLPSHEKASPRTAGESSVVADPLAGIRILFGSCPSWVGEGSVARFVTLSR